MSDTSTKKKVSLIKRRGRHETGEDSKRGNGGRGADILEGRGETWGKNYASA